MLRCHANRCSAWPLTAPTAMAAGCCNWPRCCAWAAAPSGQSPRRPCATNCPKRPETRCRWHGASADVPGLLRALAERPGPIVGLVTLAPGDAALPLERLLIERSLSINTAAAGGNASLMTIG